MNGEVSEELVEAGRGYENLFVPSLFEVWTKHLLEAADVGKGSHVVDIACGTGVLARSALARTGMTGRVVGIDPAPGMLAAAAEIEPEIEWVLSSAEALEAKDAVFDCVVSQFGIMFFEDRQKATHEMFRVLRPCGSLAIAAWRSVEHNPAYADIISILEENVGIDAADALRIPFSLGNAEEFKTLLDNAGFTDTSIESRTESARFPSSRQMVEAELRGWLPLFDIFLEEDKINEVLVRSDKRLAKYAGPSGEAVFSTSAHIVSARKPQ